jgi:hypothetical protein
MRQLIFLITLLFLMTTSYAAVYTWTDENGRPVYSQTSKPGAVRTDIKPLPPISGENPEQQKETKTNAEHLKAIEESNAARDKAREEARKAELDKADKKKACATVQSNLETLNQGGDRRFKQADGTYTYYSQQKRAEEREKLQSYIRENCN